MEVNEAQAVAAEIANKLAQRGVVAERDPEGKSLMHAKFMADEIAGGMSSNKSMRWLGYLQAMLVFHGVSVLSEEKDRNRRAVEAPSA